MAGVGSGPTYNDGRLFLPLSGLNQDGLVVLSKDDQEAIACEVRRYGHSHLADILKDWGYLVNDGPVEQFNNTGPLDNCVQYQFDHPGQLAAGAQQRRRIKVGGYETTFTSRWS